MQEETRTQAHGARWKVLTTVALVLFAAVVALLYIRFGSVSRMALQRMDDPQWESTLKDEDRALLMATPVPHQAEPMTVTTFHKVYRGDITKKQVALTFDDGPHPDKTPKLLATLRQLNVKATFFVVGMRAEQSPDLIKQEVADGHCIANHTYHHDHLPVLSKPDLATEIDACSDVINKISGKRPRFFRPPGGSFDAQVTNMAHELGYQTVLWSINTGDFHRPGVNTIVERALHNVSNGTIILFHDGVQQTIDALPTIVTELRKQGYEFVTMDEMVPPPATKKQ